MKSIIFFVLLFVHISYGQKGGVDYIVEDLMVSFGQGLTNFTGSEKQQLMLPEDGKLGNTNHALVWKGFYSDGDRIFNQTVAIKIIWDQQSHDEEMAIFKALNATENPNIEQYGIPRIFYSGIFLKHYYAIAMTYFNETLTDRYEKERANGRSLTDLTILGIFMQAVKGLKYLNSMHVVHNDIKPDNIFFRGDKVFLADFDLSTLNDTQNEGHTPMFASRNFYLEKPRNTMDDLEALVYSMWYIANVPMAKESEGSILSKCNKKQAIARMQQKCDHFENPYVYEVMKYICVEQVLSEKKDPDYDQIIAELKRTIQILERDSSPKRLNWLKQGQPGSAKAAILLNL